MAFFAPRSALLFSTLYVAVFVAVMGLATGCHAPTHTDETPETVARNFLTALNRRDFAAAKKYSTDNTSMMLDLFAGLAAVLPQPALRTPPTITQLHCEPNGEKCTCTYIEDTNPKRLDLERETVRGRKVWRATLEGGMSTAPSIEGGDMPKFPQLPKLPPITSDSGAIPQEEEGDTVANLPPMPQDTTLEAETATRICDCLSTMQERIDAANTKAQLAQPEAAATELRTLLEQGKACVDGIKTELKPKYTPAFDDEVRAAMQERCVWLLHYLYDKQ